MCVHIHVHDTCATTATLHEQNNKVNVFECGIALFDFECWTLLSVQFNCATGGDPLAGARLLQQRFL